MNLLTRYKIILFENEIKNFYKKNENISLLRKKLIKNNMCNYLNLLKCKNKVIWNFKDDDYKYCYEVRNSEIIFIGVM